MSRFAGVLPYAYDDRGGLHLLLACERFGSEAGTWAGFAGRPEACDGGNPMATAAREGFEESCGLLGTQEFLMNVMLPAHARAVSVPAGVHFLLPFQYSSYLPHMFLGAQLALVSARGGSSAAYSPFLEKSAIKWFAAADLVGSPLRHGFRADMELLLQALRHPS